MKKEMESQVWNTGEHRKMNNPSWFMKEGKDDCDQLERLRLPL